MSAGRIELWVCTDCMLLEETGDATSFDYHYSEPVASQRIAEVEGGWRDLRKQGMVTNDGGEHGIHRICSDCDHIGNADDFEPMFDKYGDEAYGCPKCKSLDTSLREGGENEFSFRECDCCGSELGGTRHRYALFPRCVTEPQGVK